MLSASSRRLAFWLVVAVVACLVAAASSLARPLPINLDPVDCSSTSIDPGLHCVGNQHLLSRGYYSDTDTTHGTLCLTVDPEVVNYYPYARFCGGPGSRNGIEAIEQARLIAELGLMVPSPNLGVNAAMQWEVRTTGGRADVTYDNRKATASPGNDIEVYETKDFTNKNITTWTLKAETPPRRAQRRRSQSIQAPRQVHGP